MEIRDTCRFFRGSIPCWRHKEDIKVHCGNCPFYEKIENRILIIKLASAGDVLRTTFILPPLKKKYKNSHIIWITSDEASLLLLNNNYIDEVWNYSLEAFSYLLQMEFDLVICLDNDRKSCALSEIARGKEKLGFGLNKFGVVYPYTPSAKKWYLMGLFDDIKKANTETYQKIMSDICKIDLSDFKPIMNLIEEEIKFKEKFIKLKKIKTNYLKIGLNTGAGERWEKKRWKKENFLKLITLIDKNFKNYQILLYGGPEEVEINKYLLKNSTTHDPRPKRSLGTPARVPRFGYPELIDTGCDNTLRDFAALIDICDIMITGDTLALHIALSLNKKVIALFGPTSSAEIELGKYGRAIFADMPCLVCYKLKCELSPDCMDKIGPEMVLNAIKEIIK